jgi:hypothetical protein
LIAVNQHFLEEEGGEWWRKKTTKRKREILCVLDFIEKKRKMKREIRKKNVLKKYKLRCSSRRGRCYRSGHADDDRVLSIRFLSV